MSEGLKAFNNFCESVLACVNSGGITNVDLKSRDIIEKELKRLEELDNVIFLNNKKLKALQIIKEKRVWVDALIEMSLKEYNDYCKYVWNTPGLTEEEWKLLKEELL